MRWTSSAHAWDGCTWVIGTCFDLRRGFSHDGRGSTGLRGAELERLYIDMCMDMCLHVFVDICVDMCIDMCVDMCIHVFVDMCVDMCIDMCMDM